MKIVVLDGYTLNPGDLSWDELERLGEVVVYDRTASDDILARAIDADIILTNKTPLSAETLRQCHNLRYVCSVRDLLASRDLQPYRSS